MTNQELALTIVELLGKASKQPNELGKFLTDWTNAAVKWIRPVFLIADKEDEDFKAFKNSPTDTDTRDIVLAKIKKALNNDEEMRIDLLKLVSKISKDDSEASKFVNNILGNKNTIIQGGENTIHITNQ